MVYCTVSLVLCCKHEPCSSLLFTMFRARLTGTDVKSAVTPYDVLDLSYKVLSLTKQLNSQKRKQGQRVPCYS